MQSIDVSNSNIGANSSSEPATAQQLTFGQELVGLKFNPSNDDLVGKAKQLCADLADMVMADAELTGAPDYKYNLIKGKALGEILSAQILVVKLLTLKY